MNNESTKWLYDNLTAKGYNVGKDLAEFDSLMVNNEESRKWAYETAGQLGYNVGKDYDEFSSLVAPKMTEDAPDVAPMGDTPVPFRPQETEEIENLRAEKKRLEGLLGETRLKADERRKAISTNAGAFQFGMAPITGNAANEISDKELTKYSATENELNEAIREVDRRILGEKPGFWQGMMDATLRNPSFYTLGLSDMADSRAKLDISENGIKDDTDKALADAIYTNSQLQETSDKGFLYRAGNMFGHSIPFMVEMAATGGFSGVSNLGKKAVKEGVEESVKQKVRRMTGVVADDFIEAAMIANTAGAASTQANILDRKAGTLKKDEDGDFYFDNKESWLGAAYKGEMSSVLEWYSEKLGNHLDGKLSLAKGLDKLGAKKISKALTVAQGNDLMKAATTVMKQFGVNSVLPEVLEEEANIVLNGLLVDSNEFNKLFDLQTQADIIGGMYLTVGTMRAIPGAIGSVGYFKNQRNLNKAEKEAEEVFGEAWNGISEELNNASNEDVSKVLAKKMDDAKAESKPTLLNYYKQMMIMRGYNIGSTKRESDTAGVEYAYQEAYSVEPTGETATRIIDDLRKAEDAVRVALNLDKSDDVDAFVNNISAEKLANGDEEIINAVNGYKVAKARFEGVSDNVKDNVEQESQESDKVIQDRINKTDGMVYSTTLHGGERVFITGGTVVLDDEGYIDVANSGDLWALYPDGTKKQLREGDLREKIEVFNTDELKAAERAMIEELWRDKLNTFTYNDNQGEHVITVKQTNGEISRAVVDGVEQDVPTRFINELKDKIVQKSPAADNTAEVATETPAAGNTQTMIEPIPTETRGKVKRTAYHVVPIERTLADLESNELTEDEKIQFAQANIDEINSELQKVLKQEPKMGADIQAYKAAKAQWTVARDEWQKRLDYYNELLNRLKQPVQTSEVAPVVEGVAPQATNKMQPVRKVVSKKKAAPEMPETVEEFVASVMPKITPESFKRETGLSNGEQRQLVGYIAGKGKGGITIEQAAESIVANYNDELLGLGFTGDEQDVRDMIINILSNGNPKGYIKRSRALREAELSQQEREMADVWAEGMGFDSYENYLDYTESLLEDIEEQRKEFDETEYYNNLAGNYEYDTTGERKDFGRGGELLQGEQFVTTTPSEVIGEGYEGTAVPGDVRGGGDNALTQGETRQVNTVNDESVAEGGNAPGQSDVVGNNNANALQNGNNELNLQKEDESDNEQNQNDIPVGGQVSQSVPQGEHGTQASQVSGAQETAARLRERIESAQGDSKSGLREVENRVTREFAQENGLWIEDESKLGVPFPSGDEHNNYIDAENQVVYKVNNRMHTPSILDLLDRIEQHNKYFPDSKYSLVGFTSVSKNGDVMPVFAQGFVPDARMATNEEIDSYMGTLGFNRVGDGRYSNGEVVIKDLKPRNVLADADGDIYVVDAEFEQEVSVKSEGTKGEKDQKAEEIDAASIDDALKDLRIKIVANSNKIKKALGESYKGQVLTKKLRNDVDKLLLKYGSEQVKEVYGIKTTQTQWNNLWTERDQLKEQIKELEAKKELAGKFTVKSEEKIQEPRSVEEILENGDKLITNYNSRGEVATVALEHDGRIVAVDSYDEGVLFEHTEYDENGVSTSVTRYDKQGNPMVSGKTAYDYAKFLQEKKVEQEKADAKKAVEDVIKPFAKEKREESKPATEKIEDVGEKIGGAKKDRFAEGMARIKAELEETDETLTDKLAKLPVSQVFNFDLEKLREGGISNEAISFIKIVKDYLPAKPRKTYKIRNWVNNTLALYKLCLEAGTNWDRVNALLNGPQFTSSSLKEQFDAYMAIGGFDSGMNIGNAKLRQLDNKSGRYDENGKFVTLEGKWYVRDAGKHGGIYDTKEEAVNALKAFAGDKVGVTSGGKKKEVKFAVYQRRQDKSIFIAVKGKSDIVIQDGFKSSKEAFDYIEANNAELQERYRALLDKTTADFEDNRPREGRDYRDGKDIPAEEFRTTFGFRGVEFGNWMTQEDRRKALNECYDALMDLAAVCKVSPKALSLGGTLGMAFGARGGGKFSAHYESGKVVINLTKTKGAGSLAHEWFHALDNYFAKMGSEGLDVYATAGEGLFPEGISSIGKRYYDRKSGQMLTEEEYNERMNSHEVRREMADAWKSLMETLKKSDYYKRSAAYAGLHNSNYWTRPTELGARAFSTWVENELSKQGASNDYLANNPRFLVSEATDEQSRFMPYPFDADATWMEEAFGNLFEVMQEKVDEDENAVLYRTAENESIENVNERFNEQLDSLTEENADVVELSLGAPSLILKAAGVKDMPMKLYGNKVIKKMKKHGFKLEELKNLPVAVADPIAVFNNHSEEGNRAILTELKTADGNFLVTVDLGDGTDIDFNIVSSVFGKSDNKIANWFNKGFATYINKEKALDYLHLSAPIAEASDKQELSSATKVINDFENPIIEDENLTREGEGLLTDREVVMDSDPYSKALGRPRYTGKKMGEYVARQRMEMAKRVKTLAQKLNLNIDVLESTEGLSGKRAKAKGWYEPKGKRIVVVIPNHSSVNDAVATVLHEAVAHHGLRELFGENFDTFLQNVYNNADADVREAIETLAAQRYNGNLITATEEYLASLAENTDFEYAAKSGWWERIKDYFFKMLRGLGIEGFDGIALTDNELRYILWRSYQNLANPGMYNNVFAQAKDTALQYELKVGNYAPDALNGSMVAGEDITPEMKEGGVINPKSNRNIENKDVTLHKTKDGRIVRYEQLDLFNNDERAVTDIQRNTSEGNGNANNGAGNDNLQRDNLAGGNSLAQINVPLRPLEKGEMSLVQRIFTKSKAFDFTAGEQIESLEDVAYIFKNLEDESIENSFAVLVKDGRPMVLHLGMGGYTSTIVNTTAVAVAMENVKPDKVYFVHNHPSGALKASANDVEVLQKLRTNYGDIVEKGIIINLKSGKFGVYDVAQATSEVRDEKAGDGLEVPVEIFTFNKQVFDKDFNPSELFQIHDADDIAAFISSNRLGDRNKIGLLVCNNQLKVVGNVFTPYIGINSAAAQKIAKDVVYYTTVMGGNRPILFGRFPALSRTAKSNLEFYINSYSGGQIKLVDLVDVESSESVLNEEGAFYGDITKGNAVERVNLGEPEGGSLFREGETVTQKEKQAILKENAKAIRRLHNVRATFPITALRNLRHALETEQERLEHDRLFAVRDGLVDDANMPLSVEVNPQGMTLQERITESLLQLANDNRENVETRLAAIRAYSGSLDNVLKLMRAQKGYDKKTVDMFVGLVKMYLRNNAVKGMSNYDIYRLLGLINRASGGYRMRVNRAAEQIVEIITKGHVRELQETMNRMLKTGAEKVNASGVVVQGGVDIVGKRKLNSFRDAIVMSQEAFEEKMAKIQEKVAKNPEDAEALAELDAMYLAQQYKEKVADSKADEEELLRQVAADSEMRGLLNRGVISRKTYNEFADGVRRNVIELRTRRIDEMQKILRALGGDISEGMLAAKEFRERELAKRMEIHDIAEADLKGVSKAAFKSQKASKAMDWFVYKNPIVRGVMAGLPTYNNLLSFFGEKTAGMTGNLKEYFLSKYTTAVQEKWKNLQKDKETLEKKTKRITGSSFEELGDLSAKIGATISFWDGEAVRERELSYGQMMYIYMVNKMTDGAMKLRSMGISEEMVNTIEGMLPKKLVEMADWIQGDFLPQMRGRFNVVHQRMFGASMDEVENYFPLVINKGSRRENVDVSSMIPTTPSTITGSIIKRRVNTAAIDINANALDVLMRHLEEMEQWAAFGEFIKDNNILLSDTDFKNRVKNMKSVRYGDGEDILEAFKECAQLATGTHRAKGNELSVNLARGLNSGKIAFGYYTALKQFLSQPAVLADAGVLDVVKAVTSPFEAWEWAVENVPGFEERWKGRTAGIETFEKTDKDWGLWDNRTMKKIRNLGMTPNAWVDAAVVAVNAKAVYDSRMKFYTSIGFDKAVANKRALHDAAVSYNETQQSGLGAFVSPMQADRTFLGMLLTLFRNSQMGYQRRLINAVKGIANRVNAYDELRANTVEKYKKMGLDDKKADEAAQRDMNVSLAKDAMSVVLFGYVLNLLWALGEDAIYLLFGDDDEEKDRVKKENAVVAFSGAFEGLTLGGQAKEVMTRLYRGENVRDLGILTTPLETDWNKVFQKFQNEGWLSGAYQLVMTSTESLTGISPQRLIDDYAALVDLCKGDLEMSRRVMLFVTRLMKVPQSQIDKVYQDWAMSEDDEELLKMAKRYVDYKMNRENPLDKDNPELRLKKLNRFDEAIMERIAAGVESAQDIELVYDRVSPKYKDKLRRMWNSLTDEEAKDSATVNAELVDDFEKKMRGLVDFKVYDSLETMDDLRDDRFLKEVEAMGMPANTKKKNGGALSDEELRLWRLYKIASKARNSVNELKLLMDKRPEDAEKAMMRVRMLRAKAMNLIEGYNE